MCPNCDATAQREAGGCPDGATRRALQPSLHYARREEAQRLVRRPGERDAALEVEEPAVTGTAHGDSFEPAVGERALRVRTPRVERDPTRANLGQPDMPCAGVHFTQLVSVRARYRPEVDPGHAAPPQLAGQVDERAHVVVGWCGS